MKSFKQHRLNEAANKSLARIWQHTHSRNIGIISADRAEHSPEQRKINRQNLAQDIRHSGFGFVHARGRFIENLGTKDERPVDEHSFIVIGSKKDDSGNMKGFLKKMGKKYQQDSVIHKPHNSQDAFMIDTKGTSDTTNLGKFHPNKMSMYQTKMKGPRTFTFEETSWEFFTSFGFFCRPTQVEIDRGDPGKKIPLDELVSLIDGEPQCEADWQLVQEGKW